jgi:hypothetical protein
VRNPRIRSNPPTRAKDLWGATNPVILLLESIGKRAYKRAREPRTINDA